MLKKYHLGMNPIHRMKKLIVFGIIALFIGISVIPSSGILLDKKTVILTSRGNIFYVGGNGSGNYTKIQDAIDNATDGDTVFVYNGIYYENVGVDKKIQLIGEDRNNTIIDANKISSPVMLLVNGIKLSGFCLQNSGNNWYCDSGVRLSTFSHNAWNHKIIGNKMINNCDGLFACGSGDNVISDNIFINNRNAGMYFQSGGHNNDIYNNTIINNSAQGIFMFGCHFNKLFNNSITNNNAGIVFQECDENNVFDNYLAFMPVGIVIADVSWDNQIYNNDVENNDLGIKIRNFIGTANYNCVYHNNLINNTKSGYDECTKNKWNKYYPICGNYWDDYNGIDNDSDGIGDIPYLISGGDSQDNYPLMEPYGTLRANTCGPYFGLINIPIDLNGYICGGMPPYEWFWDLGDGNTSYIQNFEHIYDCIGKYSISLSVVDNVSNVSNHTSYIWIQEFNSPPDIPDIDGPNKGTAGRIYKYTFTTYDPEGLQVWYYIDWDDGSNTGWLGPYNSGMTITRKHVWTDQGTYTIRCKAMDPYDDESSYGELTVKMPRDKSISNSFLLRFLERYPLIQYLLKRFGL